MEEHRLRVLEEGELRRLFGPKMNDLRGGWTKVHNEELYNLYSSPNILGMIKCRRMGWVEHVTEDACQ
jgi:hypothetical protein